MPVTPEFRAFVEDQLDAIVPVHTRRMFGGVGIYTEEIFFALIADDVLYLKVDEATVRDYQERGLEPFRPRGGDGPAMSYRPIPAGWLEDPEMLEPRVLEAVEVARRAARG